MLGELRPGRLFTHRRLSDAHNSGPVYCRLIGWDAAKRLVIFTMIRRPPDAPAQNGEPWRMPVNYFFERCLGGWYQGEVPPAAPRRPGLRPPLPQRRDGSSVPGSH